jgi:adenylate cyclase
MLPADPPEPPGSAPEPEPSEPPEPAEDEDAQAAGADGLATDPRLLAVARALRKVLPGDSRLGDDPLSLSGDKGSQVLGRRLTEATAERPNLLREAGLTALQVWQAMGQTVGRMPVKADLTIAFTDLVDFSRWSLKAGDAAAVALLRDVSAAIEPPVGAHAGEVVKRLGDGMMAAFVDPTDGLAAIFEAGERLRSVEADGYRPRLRAGLHVGRPERVGDDYFGVDVNVAARVAEAAAGDEVLVTDRVLAELEPGTVRSRRKLLFRAKGVPSEIRVYTVRPA